MKRLFVALALIFLSVCAYAEDGQHWTALTSGESYGVRPMESKPFIVLAAVRGATLSEPINIGFYVLSSPACKALENPIDGPATGPIGPVGLVEIDGKNYALDGQCDGGNLTMVPSYWVTRQALLKSVRNDAVLDVWFKSGTPPGFHLHYHTEGFDKVLKGLDVSLPPDRIASALTLPLPASGKCSSPRPAYPAQAIRMNQQGVAQIEFDVGAGGHVSNLSVQSSSGSTALDNAALAAVSRAICNIPTGTHTSLPVTFGLNQLH